MNMAEAIQAVVKLGGTADFTLKVAEWGDTGRGIWVSDPVVVVDRERQTVTLILNEQQWEAFATPADRARYEQPSERPDATDGPAYTG